MIRGLILLGVAALVIGCSDSKEEKVTYRVDHPSVVREGDEPQGSVDEGEGEPVAANAEEYQEAADLVRQYYTAISRGSSRRAFDLWEKGTREFEEFSEEAKSISRAVVTFDRSGRAGTSEGMPTIEVPITLQLTTSDGELEERHETFLLRKSPDQGWRILQRIPD